MSKSAEIKRKFETILLDVLENGEAVRDEDTGEIVRVTPSAALLGVINTYLKNYPVIEVPVPQKISETLKDAKALPFSVVKS